MSTPTQKQYTLIFPVLTSDNSNDPPKVLLGHKKRGFGIHKWNGFGGKLLPHETPRACAIRELYEESALHVDSHELAYAGLLVLCSPSATATSNTVDTNDEEWLVIHVYTCTSWRGEPQESEEMKPQWWPVKDVPKDLMWEETAEWIDVVLADAGNVRIRHYVEFLGAVDVNGEGGGKWCRWHGVGKRYLEQWPTKQHHQQEQDEEKWSDVEIKCWVESVRT
jgi:8-oxo-dGTP pyrophosphatase MutT (NUDIX family)